MDYDDLNNITQQQTSHYKRQVKKKNKNKTKKQNKKTMFHVKQGLTKNVSRETFLKEKYIEL